jgi:iron complex transport system substrate-binding protein
MSVATPCVGICRLNEQGVCVGCGRTIEQISAWRDMGASERLRIMASLPVSEATDLRSRDGGAGVRPLRIVSLLPAATEMAFALGLNDAVVGVSHECDFPPQARNRPAVVRPALRLEHLSQRAIDAAVSARLASGQSLYEIDEQLMRRLRPDLIVTQDLCQVCAPSGRELTSAVASLSPRPLVLPLSPHTLEQICANLRALGRATARLEEAERLIAQYRERLHRIEQVTRTVSRRPRVFFMEWAEPIYCAGHWVAEMIALAGGVDQLARAGVDSVRTAWEEVVRWAPEVLILSPCGCNLAQAIEQLPVVRALPAWSTLPAVRAGRVFCVNANAYFARPGPRVIDGTELLAHLFHPELFDWSGPVDGYRAVDT